MASCYKTPADFNQRSKRNIERLNSGDWKDIATAILTEATLVGQPEKTELEYRVIALKTRRAEFHGLCPWVNVRRRYVILVMWKRDYQVIVHIARSIILFGYRNIADADDKTLKEIEKIFVYHFTELLGRAPKMAKYILK